jgi:hypothetical protein
MALKTRTFEAGLVSLGESSGSTAVESAQKEGTTGTETKQQDRETDVPNNAHSCKFSIYLKFVL